MRQRRLCSQENYVECRRSGRRGARCPGVRLRSGAEGPGLAAAEEEAGRPRRQAERDLPVAAGKERRRAGPRMGPIPRPSQRRGGRADAGRQAHRDRHGRTSGSAGPAGNGAGHHLGWLLRAGRAAEAGRSGGRQLHRRGAERHLRRARLEDHADLPRRDDSAWLRLDAR